MVRNSFQRAKGGLGNSPIKRDIEGSYINPVMDCCAKARILDGKIPIYKTPHTEMLTARTEAGEKARPVISRSGSLKYINTVTLK